MRNDSHSLIHNLQFAQCRHDWSSMKGDDNARWCDQCSMFLYDVPEPFSEERLLTLVQKCNPGIKPESLKLLRRFDGKLLSAKKITLVSDRARIALEGTLAYSVRFAGVAFIIGVFICSALTTGTPSTGMVQFARVLVGGILLMLLSMVSIFPVLGLVRFLNLYREVKHAAHRQLTEQLKPKPPTVPQAPIQTGNDIEGFIFGTRSTKKRE